MHHDVIEQVARVCALHGLDAGGWLERAGTRRDTPVRQFRSIGDGAWALDLATTDDGARRLRLEVLWRAWAGDHDVPVPLVVAAEPDGRWLLSHRVPPAPAHGAAYVEAAVEAARRIAHGSEPPATPDAAASSWRAPRRSRLVRGYRTVAGGVPLCWWAAARRQWQEMAGEPVVAHGDLHRGNVLAHPATAAGRTSGAAGAAGVAVVDWEFAGLAPVGSDLARLWTTAADDADRSTVLDELLRDARRRPDGARRLGAMLWWHALRLLGENLSAPPRRRTPATLEHARTVVDLARPIARDLGARVR